MAPDADSVFLLIDRAFNEFSCSSPGPKIINIPVPLLSQSSPPPKAPPVRSQWPVAPESQVQKVAELLGCAQFHCLSLVVVQHLLPKPPALQLSEQAAQSS